MAAYGAERLAPERWRNVVIASVPPTWVMAGHMQEYEQLKAFWYQYVFLTEGAEAIVANDDIAFIEGLWRDWSPGFDASGEVGRVKGRVPRAGQPHRRLGHVPLDLRPLVPAARVRGPRGRHLDPADPTHALPTRRRRHVHPELDHE